MLTAPPPSFSPQLLSAHLEAGDLIIDGGNEWYLNTLRRGEALAAKGLSFMGMGVSGGEEGARNGPAIMPGGTREAYEQVRPILEVRVCVCVLRVGGGLASRSALHVPSAAQCNTGQRSRACKGCAHMCLTLAQRCSFARALREQQQPTVVVTVATCCSDRS